MMVKNLPIYGSISWGAGNDGTKTISPQRSRLRLVAFLTAAIALLALHSPAIAEVTQARGVRVLVNAKLSPTRLPRAGSAPVAVSVGGRIASTTAGGSPRLERMSVAINAHGTLLTRGLPHCRLGHIQPSTTAEALRACRSSLVGEGRFSANVQLPEQSPFPSEGKVLAFNGRLRGKPAIFAHIYGVQPVPTSYVLPFLIEKTGGTYGTLLEASFPRVTGEWGYVTGVSLSLARSFVYRGRQVGYLSAGCPAPAGFPGLVFPLLRTRFSFAGGPTLTSTLNRSCKVRG